MSLILCPAADMIPPKQRPMVLLVVRAEASYHYRETYVPLPVTFAVPSRASLSLPQGISSSSSRHQNPVSGRPMLSFNVPLLVALERNQTSGHHIHSFVCCVFFFLVQHGGWSSVSHPRHWSMYPFLSTSIPLRCWLIFLFPFFNQSVKLKSVRVSVGVAGVNVVNGFIEQVTNCCFLYSDWRTFIWKPVEESVECVASSRLRLDDSANTCAGVSPIMTCNSRATPVLPRLLPVCSTGKNITPLLPGSVWL